MSEAKPEIPTLTAEVYREVLRVLTNTDDRFGHQFQQVYHSPASAGIYRPMVGAPDPKPGGGADQVSQLDDRWLAEYRLAVGPMRPFLAAALAEPRDPLARGLLGEALREFGWDRPAHGLDARQSPPAPITVADCLWAPDGRWSVLRGVLRWHAYGLPIAEVARVGLPHYLRVRVDPQSDLAPTCGCCGGLADWPWCTRLDFVRCPCRGVRPAQCAVCRVGRPAWCWVCRDCRVDKENCFYHAKAHTNPDRYWRILSHPGEPGHPPPDDKIDHDDDRFYRGDRSEDGRDRPQGYDPEYGEP